VQLREIAERTVSPQRLTHYRANWQASYILRRDRRIIPLSRLNEGDP